MSTAANDVRNKILHIGAVAHNGSSSTVVPTVENSVEVRLAETGLCVEKCSDVYRGLARLGQDESTRLTAVVVCVDGLGPEEMNFFPILSRIHKGIPVYVYETGAVTSKTQRAIQLGATGALTDDVFLLLSESGTESPTEKNAWVEAKEDVEVKEDVALDDERPDAKSEPDDVNVRVPWLRYSGGPARQAPTPQRNPPTSTATPQLPDTKRPPFPLIEPLLTDEELRALLADEPDVFLPDGLDVRDWGPKPGRTESK